MISETLPGVKGFSAQWNRWEHPGDFSFELCHCRRLCIFRRKLSFGCLCSLCLPLPVATVPGNVKFHICIKRLTEGFGTPLWSVLGVSGRARSPGQTLGPVPRARAQPFLTARAAHARVCQSMSSIRTQHKNLARSRKRGRVSQEIAIYIAITRG